MSASPDDVSQSDAAYPFDWGLDGLAALSPHCDVIVVVDVLRFTTAVSAAIDTGATVYPFRWKDERATTYAAERDAVLTGRRLREGLTPVSAAARGRFRRRARALRVTRPMASSRS